MCSKNFNTTPDCGSWASDQLVGGLQPSKDFHLGTHVLADRDWGKVNSPVTAHSDDVHATAINDK
jgi:hypothetical protein